MRDIKRSNILTAARSVFLRYGYKRVNMTDLAVAAGVSRPALYLLFRNKEEIFIGVFGQWIDETIADVEAAMSVAATPVEKIDRAFEIWAVRPFALATESPEARELIECTLGFAASAQRDGYARFDATVTPVLAAFADTSPVKGRLPPERVAFLLSNAVRGLKLTATTSDDLRKLIRDLLILTVAGDRAA